MLKPFHIDKMLISFISVWLSSIKSINLLLSTRKFADFLINLHGNESMFSINSLVLTTTLHSQSPQHNISISTVWNDGKEFHNVFSRRLLIPIFQSKCLRNIKIDFNNVWITIQEFWNVWSFIIFITHFVTSLFCVCPSSFSIVLLHSVTINFSDGFFF